ncbi:MAG: epoxide hydrolase [Edaphobacter sp.]|uniref:epoxide hydrolase family protein n=1 Tax=Edaphobacter sp. TaxID=1934404 RepID=UPI002389998D|nr:epoxide hydrolase family protein [Edaphobacter sp.]MDE1177540.1 epoxide hydrolase [Edaphobacter sp.]
MIDPFELPFSSADWEDLRRRIRQTRWPDEISNSDWIDGASRVFLQELCDYWGDSFDWKSQVLRLSKLPHYHMQTTGGKVHFLHFKSSGSAPIPLVMTHGWPGSFLEFLEIVPLLTSPEVHGFSNQHSFDVIIPSLPGFGFSESPKARGTDAFRIAAMWVELMDKLGYDRFAAQGGDIGAGVSTALGLRHSEHLIGIHLNYIPGSYRPHIAAGAEITPEEQNFLSGAARWYDENGAYAHLQGTRPQTLAYALNDSPVGLAAWLLEKFRAWSDCDGDVYKSFSKDTLLTNVTLYWMTQTIASSFRMYQEGRRSPLHFTSTDYVQPPCAIACFPKEIVMPPRSWVDRGYNVSRWTVFPEGGHFAAAEVPELLAADIHAFFGSL